MDLVALVDQELICEGPRSEGCVCTGISPSHTLQGVAAQDLVALAIDEVRAGSHRSLATRRRNARCAGVGR